MREERHRWGLFLLTYRRPGRGVKIQKATCRWHTAFNDGGSIHTRCARSAVVEQPGGEDSARQLRALKAWSLEGDQQSQPVASLAVPSPHLLRAVAWALAPATQVSQPFRLRCLLQALLLLRRFTLDALVLKYSFSLSRASAQTKSWLTRLWLQRGDEQQSSGFQQNRPQCNCSGQVCPFHFVPKRPNQTMLERLARKSPPVATYLASRFRRRMFSDKRTAKTSTVLCVAWQSLSPIKDTSLDVCRDLNDRRRRIGSHNRNGIGTVIQSSIAGSSGSYRWNHLK